MLKVLHIPNISTCLYFTRFKPYLHSVILIIHVFLFTVLKQSSTEYYKMFFTLMYVNFLINDTNNWGMR